VIASGFERTSASAALLQSGASDAGRSELTAAKSALDAGTRGEIAPEEVGQRFEQLFATMLVRELRKSADSLSGDGGLFGKGAGSDVYDGWFDEHVGGVLAERDALGLVGVVKAGVARERAAAADQGGAVRAEVRP